MRPRPSVRLEGRDVVILALSASAFEEGRQTVLATGADDFLHKPVTAEDLLAVIGRHLGIEPIRR